MAETLRRIVNTGNFSVLQDKLENWLDCYHVNSCDQNVARCSEILETNTRVQAQLFKLLSLTASEGGLYGGSNAIRARLLPWLSQGIMSASGGLWGADVGSWSDGVTYDFQLDRLHGKYERSLHEFETDLRTSRSEANQLRQQLVETNDELNNIKRKSSTEKINSELEVQEVRNKLRVMEEELASLRTRGQLVDNYERQLQRLRDDLSFHSIARTKPITTSGSTDCKDITLSLSRPISPYLSRPSSPSFLSRPSSPYLSRPISPFQFDDESHRVRQKNLISRFKDLYTDDRLSATRLLQAYSEDYENCQRIVFAATQEAFNAAKVAFGNFKMKIRSTLALSHSGRGTLEDAVLDYTERNPDACDLSALVADVMHAVVRSPRLGLPSGVSVSVIQPFVREISKLAWNMQSINQPLDIAPAASNEVFDDFKYRRSYDSDFTAPLVNHHIWPCLQQGHKVIEKGEACTKRGMDLGGCGRSRSPYRSPIISLTPTRSYSPVRSRSVSPRRYEYSYSGRPVSRVKFL